MVRVTILFFAMLLGPIVAPWAGPASAPDTPLNPVQGELKEYVQRADLAYQWRLLRQTTLGQSTVYEMRLISQSWKGVTWQHQLFLLIPPNLPADMNHAMMFVAGGRWKPAYDDDSYQARISKYQDVYANLALQLGTPLAVIKQVPYQPMFDGKREDALIAMSFDRYLESGDADWPLLLPMVKSVVRAMDAISEVASQEQGLEIDTFTVTGASKRGWTTWLSAVADPRVTAIAPMVIDVLDMDRQLDYQAEVWGAPSEEISDYTQINLRERFATPAGQRLLGIVDPFSYLDQLTQPKLVIIGTNDEYWPVDALNLYWGELRGPRYHLYIPNSKHRIRDYPRLFASLKAINDHAAGYSQLPEFTWIIENSSGGLELVIEGSPSPTTVLLWSARSDNRDFREAHFSATSVSPTQGKWKISIPAPQTGYQASFAEAYFKTGEGPAFSLSTQMSVLNASARMVSAEAAGPAAASTSSGADQ